MIAQGDFRKLLEASTEDRVKIFRQIFDTGLYQTLQDRLKEAAGELNPIPITEGQLHKGRRLRLGVLAAEHLRLHVFPAGPAEQGMTICAPGAARWYWRRPM